MRVQEWEIEMNKIALLLSPMFIIGWFRITFGSIIPSSWFGPSERLGYADAATPDEPSLRIKLVQWVLGSYHISTVTETDMAIITVLVLLYSALFGYLSDLAIRERAFGVSLNGTVGFVGACVGLVGYARLNLAYDSSRFGLVLVLMILSSTSLLCALSMVKTRLVDEADSFLAGAKGRAAKAPAGKAGAVSAERLARAVNRI